jgi:uncharacterized protein
LNYAIQFVLFFPSATSRNKIGGNRMDWLKKLAALLVVIGALNWGLIGLFNLNVVTEIFGSAATVTKVIYSLIGLSGLWLLLSKYKS